MATGSGTRVESAELLSAARDGDEQAFESLLEPHRRALHLHCYRLLGSLHDADDALQETSVRAWRGLDGFEPRAPFRSWLFKIATNVCLRAIERRARAQEVLDGEEAAIASYLQPYPDRLLDTEVEERESIGLAFVSVMQLLPPRQRAALVLRDVLGWSAREAAELLGDSVASVNSALQRARETLERERRAGRLARDHVPASSVAESLVVRRFLAAWEAVDVEGIVALLADDVVMTMPPDPMRLVGTAAIGQFSSPCRPRGSSTRSVSFRRVRTRNRRSRRTSSPSRAATTRTASWFWPSTGRRSGASPGSRATRSCFPSSASPSGFQADRGFCAANACQRRLLGRAIRSKAWRPPSLLVKAESCNSSRSRSSPEPITRSPRRLPSSPRPTTDGCRVCSAPATQERREERRLTLFRYTLTSDSV